MGHLQRESTSSGHLLLIGSTGHLAMECCCEPPPGCPCWPPDCGSIIQDYRLKSYTDGDISGCAACDSSGATAWDGTFQWQAQYQDANDSLYRCYWPANISGALASINSKAFVGENYHWSDSFQNLTAWTLGGAHNPVLGTQGGRQGIVFNGTGDRQAYRDEGTAITAPTFQFDFLRNTTDGSHNIDVILGTAATPYALWLRFVPTSGWSFAPSGGGFTGLGGNCGTGNWCTYTVNNINFSGAGSFDFYQDGSYVGSGTFANTVAGISRYELYMGGTGGPFAFDSFWVLNYTNMANYSKIWWNGTAWQLDLYCWDTTPGPVLIWRGTKATGTTPVGVYSRTAGCQATPTSLEIEEVP
jgi:hypothetical protein